MWIVADVIGAAFEVSIAALMGKGREKRISHVRKIALCLLTESYKQQLSQREIGMFLGRDSAAVSRAKLYVAGLEQQRVVFKQELDLIRSQIRRALEMRQSTKDSLGL
jgi:chromosomal replication initiation ATPase DnaA